MSIPRSPRGVDSITLGTLIPFGSITSRVSLIHFESFGLKMLPIFTPFNIRKRSVPPPLSWDELDYRQRLNVQRTLTFARPCIIMTASASCKRKNSRHQFSTLKQSLLNSLNSPGIVGAEVF